LTYIKGTVLFYPHAKRPLGKPARALPAGRGGGVTACLAKILFAEIGIAEIRLQELMFISADIDFLPDQRGIKTGP
jgi:hypothetical protein